MSDELPEFECNDCGLIFSVIWNNNAEAQTGEPQIVYCPRCASDEISQMN